MQIAASDHGFITGGASGLGLAIAHALHAAGARVTVADFDGERLGALDGPFHHCLLDVRDQGILDAFDDTPVSTELPGA